MAVYVGNVLLELIDHSNRLVNMCIAYRFLLVTRQLASCVYRVPYLSTIQFMSCEDIKLLADLSRVDVLSSF